MPDVESRSILVTGCSSGIGRHCALALMADGWQVFATARKQSDIRLLAESGVTALYLDYCDEGSISSAFEAVCAATGGTLDAVFNNGAYAQAGAVEDMPTQVLRAQFEANFFGWHTLTRLAIPVMRHQGHGRIVHCSSILGLIPYRWRGAYVASKYAIEGLFNSLRLELLGSGIHVSLIEPGPIRSKMGENGIRYFRENIDIENSIHAETYQNYLQKLAGQERSGPFRRSPKAVYRKLEHALNSRSPRAYYPVTIPTHFMFGAKRVLPQGAIDWLVMRAD